MEPWQVRRDNKYSGEDVNFHAYLTQSKAESLADFMNRKYNTKEYYASKM